MHAVKSSTTRAREVEVTEKAQRRRFTAEYKRKILAEVAACADEPGAIGALLRREKLYSSHLAAWRKAARDEGRRAFTAQRGPKAKPADPRDREIVELRRTLARQTKRLQQAEAIIDVQKKLSVLMGITLPEQPKLDDDDEETP